MYSSRARITENDQFSPRLFDATRAGKPPHVKLEILNSVIIFEIRKAAGLMHVRLSLGPVTFEKFGGGAQ